MTDRYEKIRQALAMGPTPGPWVQDGDGVSAADEDVAVAVCCPSDAEAAYIAACDPDTIRELLAERDQLAAALEAAREDAERYRWLRDRMTTEELADESHAMLALRVVGPIAKRPADPDYCDELDAAIDQARGKEVAGA